MKKSFCIIIILLIGFNSKAQISHDALLDTIIVLGKSQSIMSDSVDWAMIEKEMHKRFEVQPNDTGLIEATKFMLKELGDFHGRIWVKGVPHNGVIKDWIRSSIDLDSTHMAQYRYTTEPVFSTLIDEQIGYILIPGIRMSLEDSAKAWDIRKAILDIDKNHKPKAWIVDLRLNGGGTMWPMLTGLSDLLGEGKIGSFYDPNTDTHEHWLMKDQDMWIDTFHITDYGVAKLGKTHTDLSTLPVVVLTSRRTSSSGEVVALAFRNRPSTILMGEPTAGYTTGTNWQPLTDEVVLQVAINCYADRHGNTFPGTGITPGLELSGAANFDNLEQDMYVKKAIDWIEKYLGKK